ncbi:hypothetical protein IWW57_000710, partial [Coemansia sp. S610]
MDKLLRGIQSHTVDLCVLDTLLSFSNISFLFYYGNDDNNPNFMPSRILHESFVRTLLDFPILVGRLEMDGGGRAKIVVNRNSFNVPEYRESQSDVHFNDLRASMFSWDALPKGAATAGSVTTASADGSIKLASIH